MFRKYKKIIKGYFPRSRMIVIGCAIVALFLTINLIKETVNRHQIDEKIKSYENDVVRLQEENSQLVNFISSWKTSGRLEKEARSKLGLQKPGEKAILILREDANYEANKIIDQNSEIFGGLVLADMSKASNLKKWWIYFFNK